MMRTWHIKTLNNIMCYWHYALSWDRLLETFYVNSTDRNQWNLRSQTLPPSCAIATRPEATEGILKRGAICGRNSNKQHRTESARTPYYLFGTQQNSKVSVYDASVGECTSTVDPIQLNFLDAEMTFYSQPSRTTSSCKTTLRTNMRTGIQDTETYYTYTSIVSIVLSRDLFVHS